MGWAGSRGCWGQGIPGHRSSDSSSAGRSCPVWGPGEGWPRGGRGAGVAQHSGLGSGLPLPLRQQQGLFLLCHGGSQPLGVPTVLRGLRKQNPGSCPEVDSRGQAGLDAGGRVDAPRGCCGPAPALLAGCSVPAPGTCGQSAGHWAAGRLSPRGWGREPCPQEVGALAAGEEEGVSV